MKNIKAKKSNFINNKTLIVTVDTSKNSHFGYCIASDGRDIKPFKFANDRAGFNQFWTKVVITKKQFKMSKLVFGFESTSVYAEALVCFIAKKAVKIVQVNPMHTKPLDLEYLIEIMQIINNFWFKAVRLSKIQIENYTKLLARGYNAVS